MKIHSKNYLLSNALVDYDTIKWDIHVNLYT